MNNFNDLRIRQAADIGEVAPAPQRATPFTSQWTPEAAAMLARLAGEGMRVEAVQAAMAAAFGPAMTINAVRRKGRRMAVFNPALPRKLYKRPPQATGNGWSEASMAQLRHLVALGQSSDEIAAQMLNAKGERMSKNAIISKAIRMGINLMGMCGRKMPRPVTIRMAPARLPAKAVPVAKAAKPVTPKPVHAPPVTMWDVLANAQGVAAEPRHDGVPVGIMELRVDGCKWVIGDPLVPGFGYCGNRQHAGPKKQSPYCGEHHARAYGGGSESEKSASRVVAVS